MRLLLIKEDNLEGTWASFLENALREFLGSKLKSIFVTYNYDEYAEEGEEVKTIEDYKDISEKEIWQEIISFNPDAILVIKGEMLRPDFLDKIRKRNIITVLWQSDDPWRFNKESNLGKEISAYYDIVFTSEKNSLHLYERINVKAKWLPFACNPNFKQAERNITQKEVDVMFLGAPFPYRVQVVKNLNKDKKLKEYSFVFYGNTLDDKWNKNVTKYWEDRVSFDDLPQYLQKSKINLAFSDQPDEYLSLKLRHFEIPGYKNFMLAQNFSYLGDLFELGKEIEVYESYEELVEKIDFYLRDTSARSLIEKRGYERVLSEHTYEHRAEKILNEISQEMQRRRSKTFFRIDEYRGFLAKNLEYDKLRKTYRNSFTTNKMNSPEMWDYYFENHREYEFKNSVTQERVKRVSVMIKKDAKSILDLATGYGFVLNEISKRCENIEIYGCDFSKKSIEFLSKRLIGDFFISDVTNLKIDRKFEYILLLDTLEHIDERLVFPTLFKIKNLLEDEGYFIISIPINGNLLDTTFKCPSCESLINLNGHVRQYTTELLKAEVEMSGFKIIEESFVGENNYIAKCRK